MKCWYARTVNVVIEKSPPVLPTPAAQSATKKCNGQIFVCSCGHKEKLKAFQDRRQKEGAGVTKKDVAKYMNQQKKEAQEPLNNALAQMLSGIKLDDPKA